MAMHQDIIEDDGLLLLEQHFTQKWPSSDQYANFFQDTLDELHKMSRVIQDKRMIAYESKLACSTFELDYEASPDRLRVTRLVIRPYFQPYRLLDVVLMTLFWSCQQTFHDAGFVLHLPVEHCVLLRHYASMRNSEASCKFLLYYIRKVSAQDTFKLQGDAPAQWLLWALRQPLIVGAKPLIMGAQQPTTRS